jgi:hypothetical protein
MQIQRAEGAGRSGCPLFAGMTKKAPYRPWTPAPRLRGDKLRGGDKERVKLVLFDQPRPLRKNLPGNAPVGSPFSKVI